MASKKARQLERTIADVLDASAELRKILSQYERANRRLATMIGKGDPILEALERIGAEALRPEVSDATARLESARHAGRVSIVALALEEGANLSEVARRLNFSRQLASRIAAEVR